MERGKSNHYALIQKGKWNHALFKKDNVPLYLESVTERYDPHRAEALSTGIGSNLIHRRDITIQ
jgi:hypothetical protein